MTDSLPPSQHERTALAQNRTGVATLVLSLLLLRLATLTDSPLGTGLSVLALGVSFVELWVSRTSHAPQPGAEWRRGGPLRAPLVSATAVSLVAVAGLVVTLG